MPITLINLLLVFSVDLADARRWSGVTHNNLFATAV
jgi:hypothetical protein